MSVLTKFEFLDCLRSLNNSAIVLFPTPLFPRIILKSEKLNLFFALKILKFSKLTSFKLPVTGSGRKRLLKKVGGYLLLVNGETLFFFYF